MSNFKSAIICAVGWVAMFAGAGMYGAGSDWGLLVGLIGMAGGVGMLPYLY